MSQLIIELSEEERLEVLKLLKAERQRPIVIRLIEALDLWTGGISLHVTPEELRFLWRVEDNAEEAAYEAANPKD